MENKHSTKKFTKAENKAYLSEELNQWLKRNCKTFYNLISYNTVTIEDSDDINYILFDYRKVKMMKCLFRLDDVLKKFEKYHYKYKIKNIDKERQERYKRRIYKALDIINEKQKDLIYNYDLEYEFCPTFKEQLADWSMRQFKDALDSCGNIKK